MSQVRAVEQKGSKKKRMGSPVPLKRLFTREGTHPYDEIEWVKRDATVGGGSVFEQKDAEFPEFWSQDAVNITAAKYFRGKLNTPERETSVKQMIDRVVKNIRKWGEDFGYFADANQANVFEHELTHILVNQKGSFNSPVWFNVGMREKPQCSACFILSVEDSMGSILEWIKTEGTIFKGGSGSGINLSPLRSKLESLSQGGKSSGPVSFMRGADSVAGMIKSGGTTRRAAKMVVLNIDHPDILEFVQAKAKEEKKVRALMDAGYNMADLNDEAWNSIQFQNANNSVRITDDFMEAVAKDGEWKTSYRHGGANAAEPAYGARELLKEIAKAAWECGDPGVQFDTIINKWHTCPNSGRINASNPCSEYMHLDDSACNLASINLLKFMREDGTFMVKEFKHTVDVFILAQDIIVDGSSYPTPKIAANAHAFRELGLGFANLGALLMRKGIPYDSEEGHAWGGAIASLLTGEAYRYSSLLARRVGPFEGYEVNKEPMQNVIGMHRDASRQVNTFHLKDATLAKSMQEVWDEAYALGEEHGFRNSQATVIAPTGTISFMMGCDTTGIEPDFSLVKMKQLVGGGWMKIVNASVDAALEKLAYGKDERDAILAHISEQGTIEGAPYVKEEHLPVFDCAVRAAKGTRSISWKGHVKMVAAVQPFISGAISKTFNMPHETSEEEIAEAYMMAWKLGIKAFAVYRDGSKATQPLNTAAQKKKDTKDLASREAAVPARNRLPVTRVSETHKFAIAGHDGYITYGMYEDGTPGEIFIKMSKQGSTLSGLLDAFAISVSVALQYGVPLKRLVEKFIYTRFEPSGFTENANIRIATSILDYIFRYLASRFLSNEDLVELGLHQFIPAEPLVETKEIKSPVAVAARTEESSRTESSGSAKVSSETLCKKCGGMMIRTGTCLTCIGCGDSSGGCS
jgi:ribonucleoside-diphosphate reductase alpha chain